jgi:hypothetical protein
MVSVGFLLLLIQVGRCFFQSSRMVDPGALRMGEPAEMLASEFKALTGPKLGTKIELRIDPSRDCL